MVSVRQPDGTHRQRVASFKQDWATPFALLRDGRIHPVIAGTYSLLQATDAQRVTPCR